MDRRDTAVTLPWLGSGTKLLTGAVNALPDDALRTPSALPGWSRAHVVAHVARNAEALTRLVTWARTGIETPMYSSREQRAAEIESSAQAPADVLRAELATTAADLDAALAALDDTTWQAEVRSALGRPIPAAEIPWMRVREVWLHAVDLDAGVSVADVSPDVVDTLLDDSTGTLSAAEGCPSAVLAPTDRDRTWTLGPASDEPLRVRGDAAWVLGWLVGRTGTDGVEAVTADGTPVAVPAPPRWL
ncbi:maleylpyruvate isomerase family mycothiol-dependent enzyme [Pseudonocardia sp. DSM 110487]|uniref:maleylpyruvate isomerase family mycothiol-dependent enzyme n=1 Tax=Pseudonocardia sp. DSM 110487 TaxID=2865833 RepID=UPI001C6A1E74|nr:maleylpyruvate isomerase family mycothiol-dependent enzyme [Pseudonocardia sp. DSM 110487]QYN36068.1 maleylpyruvate isomerase family mycothiol-dependent enzyme [Pseudonocardia sp. DSM 110487]